MQSDTVHCLQVFPTPRHVTPVLYCPVLYFPAQASSLSPAVASAWRRVSTHRILALTSKRNSDVPKPQHMHRRSGMVLSPMSLPAVVAAAAASSAAAGVGGKPPSTSTGSSSGVRGDGMDGATLTLNPLESSSDSGGAVEMVPIRGAGGPVGSGPTRHRAVTGEEPHVVTARTHAVSAPGAGVVRPPRRVSRVDRMSRAFSKRHAPEGSDEDSGGGGGAERAGGLQAPPSPPSNLSVLRRQAISRNSSTGSSPSPPPSPLGTRGSPGASRHRGAGVEEVPPLGEELRGVAVAGSVYQ
jgi:hypothetical protein